MAKIVDFNTRKEIPISTFQREWVETVANESVDNLDIADIMSLIHRVELDILPMPFILMLKQRFVLQLLNHILKRNLTKKPLDLSLLTLSLILHIIMLRPIATMMDCLT